MPAMTVPTTLVVGAVGAMELPSWSATAVTDVPTAPTLLPTAVVIGVTGLPPTEGGGGASGSPPASVGASPEGAVGEGGAIAVVVAGPFGVTCPTEALPGLRGEPAART